MALAAQIPANVSDLDEKGGVTTSQFAVAHSNLVADVQRALNLPALVPVAYTSSWIGRRTPELMSLRRLEMAVLACARHSESQADLMAATGARLATVKLGQQGTRGGLFNDFMVGSEIQINGLIQIANSLHRMDPLTCGFALNGLKELQASQEPLSSCVARERHWRLVGNAWWRDWDTAKELPAALLNPIKDLSIKSGIYPGVREGLERAYAETEAAVRRRLTALGQGAEARGSQ